jgi:DNA polymerase-3 subunit epsilon
VKGLPWLGRRTPGLDETQRQRLEALPGVASGEAPLREQRFVVLDLETTGLNTSRDLVLAIGAVVIDDGAIQLGQQFERTLQRDNHQVSESVLIHGIGPDAVAAGSDPAGALLDFLEFLGDSPLLAFHAPFDQRMLARALRQSLGHRLAHPFIDLAELAPLLFAQANIRQGGLDDWIAHFGLQVQQRHNASADALATAELALILFSQARRQGLDSFVQLEQRLAGWRRRQRTHSL